MKKITIILTDEEFRMLFTLVEHHRATCKKLFGRELYRGDTELSLPEEDAFAGVIFISGLKDRFEKLDYFEE
jgi:hypothetical protein